MNKVATLTGVAALSAALLGANPVSAGHFNDLSEHHTNFGVSQFLAGAMNLKDVNNPIRLSNPNHVTHAVAALGYVRVRLSNVDDAEEFEDCEVLVLTPHASVQFDLATSNRAYVEVISAPVVPVRTMSGVSRLADGLGIIGDVSTSKKTEEESGGGKDRAHLNLIHPALFTLPDNDVVAGQKLDAIDCVCNALTLNLGLSGEIFSDFGIVGDTLGNCPAPGGRR